MLVNLFYYQLFTTSLSFGTTRDTKVLYQLIHGRFIDVTGGHGSIHSHRRAADTAQLQVRVTHIAFHHAFHHAFGLLEFFHRVIIKHAAVAQGIFPATVMLTATDQTGQFTGLRLTKNVRVLVHKFAHLFGCLFRTAFDFTHAREARFGGHIVQRLDTGFVSHRPTHLVTQLLVVARPLHGRRRERRLLRGHRQTWTAETARAAGGTKAAAAVLRRAAQATLHSLTKSIGVALTGLGVKRRVLRRDAHILHHFGQQLLQ